MADAHSEASSSMKQYYDRRAREYDETSWLAYGQETSEAKDLGRVLGSLPPLGTLDVAVGTGFISRYLPGDLTCIDQSAAMLDEARPRLPSAAWCVADAMQIPFRDASFGRVFTAHFYGHLQDRERRRFLDEAKRLARELVVVDSIWSEGLPSQLWQDRPLKDGSIHRIWKRYFTPRQLAEELGGRVIFAGATFVAAVTSWSSPD